MRILSFYESFAAAFATGFFGVMWTAQMAGAEIEKTTGLVLSLGLAALALGYAGFRVRAPGHRTTTADRRPQPAEPQPFQDPLREQRLNESVVDWMDDSQDPPATD